MMSVGGAGIGTHTQGVLVRSGDEHVMHASAAVHGRVGDESTQVRFAENEKYKNVKKRVGVGPHTTALEPERKEEVEPEGSASDSDVDSVGMV